MKSAADDVADASDSFHCDSVDLDEYPSVLRGIRKCRSFRADLKHKLEIIVRANGGWGNQGIWRASLCLGVSRHTLRRWLGWLTTPRDRVSFQRIDNVYENSLELLAKKLCRRKSKQS